MYKIGIDLGGTKIEGIILDVENRELFRKRIETEQKLGYDHILNNINQLYQIMVNNIDNSSHTLGIGTPGSISPKTGLLKNSNTLCLNKKPLKDDLQKLLNRKIEIQNDANCFTLAEAMYETEEKHELVFGVIMGTGCGGGIIFNNKIITGPQAIAGEWGHMSINPNGPQCWCGSQGCIERYISGGGLEERYLDKYGIKRTAKEIVTDYKKNEKNAVNIINVFFENFGMSIANIINILDPNLIVLGGGLSNIDDLYTVGIEKVKKYVFSDTFDSIIKKNRLGDSAGVIGAAMIGV